MLLTCPPRKAKRWTEADIDPSAEAGLVRLFDRLYELQPTTDDDGEPRPVLVRLSRDAKAAWKAYYNAHAVEQADLTGDMAAAWSKLEEYAARLALVVHFIRWAAGDPTLTNADIVDAASMNAGIALAQVVQAGGPAGVRHAGRIRRREWPAPAGRVDRQEGRDGDAPRGATRLPMAQGARSSGGGAGRTGQSGSR